MSCNSWSEVTFNSLYAEPSRNGLYKPKEFHGRGARIVNMGELFGYEWIGTQEMQRVELNDSEIDKFGLLDGDLLFGRRSLVESGAGKCSLVTASDGNLAFESSIIRVRLDNAKAHPRYFYYYFNSPQGRAKIAAIVGGANVKGIRGSDLEKIKVALPPLDVQKECATRVSYFDDLISNTQERIQLLEEAARVIYADWFVNHRFPGHARTECAPTKWDKTSFQEVAALVGGGTPSTDRSDYWDGDIHWVTPTDITRNDSIVLLDTQRKITEQGLGNSNARLLPPRSILMTSRASIGYFALSDEPVCTNQGFISLVPHSPESRYYLLFNLMARKDEIESLATGATFKEISKKTFRTLQLLMPNRELIQAFNATIEPMIDQIFTLKRQLVSLRQARDLLLPRLISGQLRL